MSDNNIQSTGAPSGESFSVDIDALEKFVGGASDDKGGVPSPVSAGAGNLPDIDDRFKGLPEPEARFRTLQSRYDNEVAERNKMLASLNELEPYKNFVNQLMSDEKMAIAFINKINPNLIPKKDMSQAIKTRLKEHFGENFKPQLSREQAEREDPGGKDWQYYRILDDITKNVTNDDPQHGLTIEQYRAKQKALMEEENRLALKEIEDAKKEFNATDQEIKATSEWGNSLKFKELLRLRRLLSRLSSKTPGIVNVSGGTPGVQTDREKMLKDIFSSK